MLNHTSCCLSDNLCFSPRQTQEFQPNYCNFFIFTCCTYLYRYIIADFQQKVKTKFEYIPCKFEEFRRKYPFFAQTTSDGGVSSTCNAHTTENIWSVTARFHPNAAQISLNKALAMQVLFLVDPKGFDSRLRARSDAALTPHRGVIHSRVFRIP